MRSITLPIILTAVAIIIGLTTYRAIQRGGARFYALEREALLRQATFGVVGSMLFFLAAVGLLLYERQQYMNQAAADSGIVVEGLVTPTPTPSIETLPPTETPTPTPDPNEPTPAPTPRICRAIVEGTSGNGLTLRDTPGGARVDVLPDGAILTLLDEPAVRANELTWLKVRSIKLDEGWVADTFLVVNDRSCLPGASP
jgi:hypothetical protein